MDRCDTECDAGHYGVNCVNTCTDRKCFDVISSCDRYTGSCDRGCLPGWRGVDCTQECGHGTYGQNCSMAYSDRKCAGDSSCDHVRGTCVLGCVSGWKGEDCNEVCDSQHYGANCAEACASRHCKGNSSCNSTGACDNGCKTGWTLTDCTACETHLYGPDCTKTYSTRHCMRSSSCNSTGGCDNGCEERWTETDCTVPASVPQQDILIPAVTVTAIVVAVVVAVAVGVIIWRRRRPALEESESHDYYNTSHLSKPETKQSPENEETNLEAGTYECLNGMSNNAQGSAETYCTLNTDKPGDGASDEVADKEGDDIYEPTEPRTYETLDSTSRDMDGDYNKLCEIK
ncbi:protein draper-like [Haliotis rubra]|uniref:protein draper-like n=1 Tax=Haliotis rubra TaxID=36100 RepID=UPI001EE5BF4C|nr:protein draper-like [Haliotis rubra]